MTPQEFEHVLKCMHTFDRSTAAYTNLVDKLRDHDEEQLAEITRLRQLLLKRS